MELRDYLHVIRARKGIIIASALIVALTALSVSLIQPKTYAAEAKVLVSETDTGAALLGTLVPELSSQPERALQTQVQLVRIRPIAEATIKRLNLQVSPEDFAKQVEVTAEGQTNIVTIHVEASTPERAARIATVMATEYVLWSQDLRRRSLKEAADEVQRRLDIAQNQILDLGKKIQASGKTDQLSAELQIATGAYTTLAEKLETLRINQRLETGGTTVVEPAAVDPNPVSPLPLRNTLLGLAVGLVFGVGIAFLSEYLDNTIRSTDEAERVFGTAVLGHHPDRSGGEGGIAAPRDHRCPRIRCRRSVPRRAQLARLHQLPGRHEDDCRHVCRAGGGKVDGLGEPGRGARERRKEGRSGVKRLPPVDDPRFLRGEQLHRPVRRAARRALAQGSAAAAGRLAAPRSHVRQDAAEPERAARFVEDEGGHRVARGVGGLGHHRHAAACSPSPILLRSRGGQTACCS